jgi:hypothetical protein
VCCLTGDSGEGPKSAKPWVPSPAEIGPFPIVALIPHATDPARFLLSASGNASRHLFDLGSINEEPVTRIGMSAAITSAQHSHTGVHFVTGSCDGAVRVTPVQPFTYPRRGDVYWETQVHDMRHRVTSACVTFDGTAVVSTASDGAMFSHKLEHHSLVPGQPQAGLENTRFCTLEDCTTLDAEDIDDNNAYTIEQGKQQREKDMLMAAAEAKKATLRQAIAQCVLNVATVLSQEYFLADMQTLLNVLLLSVTPLLLGDEMLQPCCESAACLFFSNISDALKCWQRCCEHESVATLRPLPDSRVQCM